MQAKPVLAALALVAASLAAGCSEDIPPAPLGDADIVLQPFLTGFAQPVFLTHAGDGSGRLFIVEQGGTVKLWEGPTAGSATTYLHVDQGDTVSSGGERGLLGLAFHPDFEENGRLFVYYTATANGGDITIAEYHAEPDASSADAGSGHVLLTVEHSENSNHNGGMLAFGPDGYLYAGLGDGGGQGDPDNNAQDLDTLLGKIIRLDVDNPVGSIPYLPPPDNPFRAGEGRSEIWDYGLRNPWRFSFDRATGDLWIGDVGQQDYEEIDLEPADSPGGVNYGWSRYEGKHVFEGGRSAPHAVMPIAEYDHDGGHCSVTGGYVYRGQAIPSLVGTYLFADYCSGVVWTLKDPHGGQEVRRVLDTSHSITSFGEDEAGELYVLDHGGGVLKVVAA